MFNSQRGHIVEQFRARRCRLLRSMHPHHVVTLYVRLPPAPTTSDCLIPLLSRIVVSPIVDIHFVRTASPIGSTLLLDDTAKQALVAYPRTPAPLVGSLCACLL